MLPPLNQHFYPSGILRRQPKESNYVAGNNDKSTVAVNLLRFAGGSVLDPGAFLGRESALWLCMYP